MSRHLLLRAVLVRAALLVIVVALVAPLGFWPGLALGLLGALVVAADLARRSRPLEESILELAGDAGGMQPGSRSGFRELAAVVQSARRRLAEARWKAERERDDLLAILGAASEGFCVLDPEGRVELINDGARRLLNSAVDPLGRTLPEVTSQPELISLADALLRGESPEPLVVVHEELGGSRRIAVAGRPIRSATSAQRALLTLEDETDLARLLKARTDFVANVTHEMRSPLASILGFAETLAASDDVTPEERADHLERILRNAHRLDDIIRDLIELSRLEHKTRADVAPASVRLLVDETVKSFADLAQAKGVVVEVEPRELPERLPVDAALVRQALTNLVENAIKYTPAGGSVRVRAELGQDRSGRVLELGVADTGPGIRPEHQNRIFERFYRVDSARSRALGGTGLGLAIVKHAAALHGGTVELETTPGRGAHFRLLLPIGEPRGPLRS